MLRFIGFLILLGLLGCQHPTLPSESGPRLGSATGLGLKPEKELGTIKAIYPHLGGGDRWFLEYRFTLDTVFVDFEAAKSKTADPAWKQALTSGSHTFYDNGSGCMYARTVQGCLAFLKKAGLP